MLNKIHLFLQRLQLQPDAIADDPDELSHACAVLLVEVMRADGEFSPDESQAIHNILQQHFALSANEAQRLLARANQSVEHATDFYQFTRLINQHYSIEQKIDMVKLLWQVARADGEVASIEQHQIRKIADLLHLRHNEYIHSKLT